ncbi:DUF892 family protein [Mucilaginibacter litoreus]|uniref:DUF892 family protein n=1 Tax=Mucilaginibacter litoreus TaxID=1048221 RepID=A0ABW3AXU8_9SPHI
MNETVSLTKPLPEFSDPKDLKGFFLAHLSRIYCAKLHLTERLPELAEQAHYRDLRLAILGTLDEVQMQITRMDDIFLLLDGEFSMANCEGMISMVEDAYTEIYLKINKPALSDMSFLYYMYTIESMERSSFRVLQIAALKMPNNQVSQLLTELFDDAKADRALMRSINEKYLKNS